MKILKPLFWGAMALLSISSTVSGQYYSRSYNNTRLDFAYYGEVVQYNDRGNLISGVTTFGPPINNRQAKIVRTDPAGTMFFGNNYSITNAGVLHDIESAFASEVRNGVTGFAGTIREPGNPINHIYYARLDNTGATLSAVGYDLPGYNNIMVTGIYNDSFYDQFIILGSAEMTAVGGYRIGFILSVDPQFSNILWGHTYDYGFSANRPCETKDAVLNIGKNELAVVGNVGTTGNRDAIVFFLDPLTGLPAGGPIVATMLTSNYDDVLNSIVMFDNPPLQGYALSGFSNQNGDYDAWAVTGDFSMAPWSINSQLYDNAGAKEDNRAYSIIDRMDTGGNTTFFLGGNATVIPFGPHQEVDIYKLDAALNLTANFMEGGNLHQDYIVQLGQYDGTGSSPDPGLISFGTKTRILNNNSDQHINKFYFSGHIPCSTNFVSSVVTPGPQSYTVDYTYDDSFLDFGLAVSLASTVAEVLICDGIDPAGSNAKMAPGLTFAAASGTKGNLAITLENEGDKAMTAEVIVTDLLGRVWMRKGIQAEAGIQEIELPMNLQGQSSGIYLITVRSESGQTTKKLFLD